MSAPYSAITTHPGAVSEEADLGLQLPVDFDLQPLFPQDRLLRLHPNWFVSNFEQDGLSFTAAIKDYVTEEEFLLSGTVVYNKTEAELLCIKLSGAIETEIVFLNFNSRLNVRLSTPEEDADAYDPLLLWIRAIREYIRIYLKRTPVTLFFRLIMNRMVLQMNPSQRKICLMMARFTVLEILVIVFIVVGYVIFVL